MSRAGRSALVTIGLGSAAVATLVGCTSSGSHSAGSASAKPAPSGSASAGVAVGPALTPAPALPLPSGNNPTLFHQVTQSTCAAVPGGWGITGTVHNPSAAKRTYHLTIYFTINGGTVINFAATDVVAAPGQTAHWSAAKKFAAAPVMHCVIVTVK